MSVRGTTHARHTRKVVIMEGEQQGGKILCAWDVCDRDGTMLHEVRVNESKPGFPAKLARYVFCTDRHKQYFVSSHWLGHGNLPAGYRSSIL